MRTYRQAWHDALYAPGGFFVSRRGAGLDFRTSATSHPALLAEVLADLLGRLHATLGGTLDVVDVGAAVGGLLAAVVDVATVPVRPVAVEVGDRLPEAVRGLLMAHEWLDTVPVTLALDGCQVLEDGTCGPPLEPAEAAWLDRWWPGASGVCEVGTARDEAWAAAVARVTVGAALAVDYVATSPTTLAGFERGRGVVPRLDGSTDITSHVVLASCAEAAGAPFALRTQREVVPPSPPHLAGDPVEQLAALARSTAVADLRDPTGLGAFGWLLHGRGVDPAGLLG